MVQVSYLLQSSQNNNMLQNSSNGSLEANGCIWPKNGPVGHCQKRTSVWLLYSRINSGKDGLEQTNFRWHSVYMDVRIKKIASVCSFEKSILVWRTHYRRPVRHYKTTVRAWSVPQLWPPSTPPPLTKPGIDVCETRILFSFKRIPRNISSSDEPNFIRIMQYAGP